MYKCEPYLPSSSKIFRQPMYTWWRREQYMSVHSPDLNFPGQMSYFYPTPNPIGILNPWACNMGMNNMDSAAFPCCERGSKFGKSSKKNDKTTIPRTSKISEKGFELNGQCGPRHIPLVHPSSKHQGQLSARNVPSPVHPSFIKQQDQLSPWYIPPSSCFKKDKLSQKSPNQPLGYKQPSQFGSSKFSSPVQHSYHTQNKDSFVNCKDISRNQICRFCLQNGERREFYSNHQLKDCNGKVTCPILQRYVCDICKATGADAHTRAYCPFYKERNKKPLAVMLKQTNHDSCGRIRK